MSSLPIPMSNSDIGRYMRHMAGESVEEIALADNVKIATIEQSVARGANFEAQHTVRKIQQIRDQGALKNELFRQSLREDFEPEVKLAIGKLLKAKNTAVEVNKETGAVTLREYDDLKIMIEGVNIYRKTVSLEEKPQTTTLIQNNIQQNNTQNNVATGAGVFDFETELAQIRRQQKEAHSMRVIDVPSSPVADNSEGDSEEGVGF